jgi:hypothetical protein
MTRKHFNKLAEIVKETNDEADRRRLCIQIGKMCAKENQYFDWSRWELACGV